MSGRGLQSQIADVRDAFGVEAYWSMAGRVCIEAQNEHGELAYVSFERDSNGIWQKLAQSAREQLDLEAWLS